MPKTKVNDTTKSFPRSSMDNPLRSPDVFSGPYSRPQFRLNKPILAVLLACALFWTLVIIGMLHV